MRSSKIHVSWFVSGEQICETLTIYFVITKFNILLLFDLPFFSQEHGSNYTWAEYHLQQNTFRWYYTWAEHYLWAVICRSHGRLLANGKEEKTALNDNKFWFRNQQQIEIILGIIVYWNRPVYTNYIESKSMNIFSQFCKSPVNLGPSFSLALSM